MTLIAGAATACQAQDSQGPDEGSEPGGPSESLEGATDEPDEAPGADEQPNEGDPETFTIFSSGDVLPHDAVIAAAAQEDGGHDFVEQLSGVQHWIEGADLALCGLEVPIAPPGTEPVGYPVFGAPEGLAESLAEVGFDGCATATNHSLDMGMEGLEHTLVTLDSAGLGHAGTARTEEEAAEPQLYTLERGGREIVVAHVANTQIHNDPFYPPQDAPWAVSDGSPDELSALAEQARSDGADLVIASVHWGEEYAHSPNDQQRDYAAQLADGGQIDLVFGNHTHTPQPMEELQGGPEDEGMWVTWSLGNFFANQDEECCIPETAVGVMAFAEAQADEEGARITGMSWSPVTVDREGASRDDEVFRGIYPLAELMDGEHSHDIPQDALESRWERVLEVVGEEQLISEAPEAAGESPEVHRRSAR